VREIIPRMNRKYPFREERKAIPLPRRAGFTLIEVVAVVVVVSILAALAVTRIRFDTSLQAEVDKMKSQLRYVQHVALCGNNTYTWRMTVNADSYSFTRWDGTNSVGMALPGATGSVNNTIALPAGITVTSGTGVINFDQWGSPGSNNSDIRLGDGTVSRIITVTKNTGFVQ
jgi:prepilin-type N-terminal cleavage/methylation domain-containing protein